MIDFSNFEVWLKARYDVDAQSRNRELLNQVIKHLEGLKQANILDLGSGMGSNTIYLANTLPFSQHFTLLDMDKSLLQSSIKHIKQQLLGSNWNYGDQFQKEGKVVTLKTTHGSILDLPQSILENWNTYDLVTANAVFDLFTRDEFNKFLSSLPTKKPLYFSINYENTSFKFRDIKPDNTNYFTDMYDKHMKRVQKRGVSMGPDCVGDMLNLLKHHGYTTHTGVSNWHIANNDNYIASFLLYFMTQAIPEILQPDEIPLFNTWIHAMKLELQKGNVVLEVNHQDIFAF